MLESLSLSHFLSLLTIWLMLNSFLYQQAVFLSLKRPCCSRKMMVRSWTILEIFLSDMIHTVYRKAIVWGLYCGSILTSQIEFPQINNSRLRFLSHEEATLLWKH
jgi:hypothetical protein